MSIIDKSKFEELKSSGQLPSPKGVALAVLQLAQKNDVAVSEIAHLIKTDPALAGRIIKAANAGGTYGRRPIASIPDAIIVLGLPVVRHLTLGFSLISNYRQGECKNFDYQGFWSRSLVTAIAAQALALRVKATSSEEGFIEGLLSKVGCLALATLYPKEYSNVIDRLNGSSVSNLARLEQEAFAVDHNELTAALLEDWGLPKMLVDPIFYHEHPETSKFSEGSRGYVLTQSLNLASHFADVCLAPSHVRRNLLPRLFLLSGRVGIESEAIATLSDQIVKDWQEWGTILNVPTQNMPPFAELANTMPQVPLALEVSAEPNKQQQSSFKLRLLAVDDDPSVLLMLKKVLGAAGHTVYTATNGREALNVALEMRPQLIITDWVMPEMDGINFCKALRETKLGRSIYVLILTSLESDDKIVEAFEAGVDDYVIKPFSPRVLGARLRAGQRVIQLQEEIEQDRENIRHFAAELAVTNRRLQEAAMTDPLTGFHNRRYAMERIEQEWSAAKRSGRPLSCMLIDLDNFKRINDTYGHDAGDAILRETAAVLKRSVRAEEVLCRIGGDELLVICPNTNLEEVQRGAERLRQVVTTTPVKVGSLSIPNSISIGIATREESMLDPSALIKLADQAVYLAKQGGRNCVRSIKTK